MVIIIYGIKKSGKLLQKKKKIYIYIYIYIQYVFKTPQHSFLFIIFFRREF